MRILISIALLLTVMQTQAKVIADTDVPELITATSSTPELKLNGASLRKFYTIVNTYIGALYLENLSQNPEEIIAANTYKRMEFRILLKKLSGRRLATAMYDALQINTTKEEAAKLESRIHTLIEFFARRMEKNDIGYIEWVPGIGNRVVVNNEMRGVIPGKDLNDAILRIWIGDNPVTDRFKQEILGLTVEPLRKKKFKKR
jgi:hypothetical protein